MQQPNAHAARQPPDREDKAVADDGAEIHLIRHHHRVHVRHRERPEDAQHQNQHLRNDPHGVSHRHITIEAPADVDKERHAAGNRADEQPLLPVRLDGILVVRPGEGVFIARPIAGDVAESRRERAGNGDARNQNQQRDENHVVAGLHGFAQGCLVNRIQHSARLVHLHRARQRHNQADDTQRNRNHRGQPRHEVHQVHAAQPAHARAEHLHEQLPAVLRQVVGRVVALAALAVVVGIHQLVKHRFVLLVRRISSPIFHLHRGMINQFLIIPYSAQKAKKNMLFAKNVTKSSQSDTKPRSAVLSLTGAKNPYYWRPRLLRP